MTQDSTKVEQLKLESLDLVGIAEIAERLDVERSTVNDWRGQAMRSDGTFPAQDLVVSRTPIWIWRRVADWARDTGRLRS